MQALRKTSRIFVLLMIFGLFLQPLRFAVAQTASSSEQMAVASVSINKANMDELQAVRGIGPALAERIVSYRESNGKFKSLEDLKQVKGIGEAKFVKIKDQITL